MLVQLAAGTFIAFLLFRQLLLFSFQVVLTMQDAVDLLFDLVSILADGCIRAAVLAIQTVIQEDALLLPVQCFFVKFTVFQGVVKR